MASKHVLMFSSINEFLNNNNVIKRGENALQSNHVKNMQFDADLMTIRGQIHASMKDKVYNVEIVLNKSGNITSGICSCPRGIKCHHIATLALFGHYNISITDKECSWNAPKAKTMPLQVAEEIYPPKLYVATTDKLSEEDKHALKSKLADLGSTVGFTWLLQDEPQECNEDMPMIEDIIFSKEFAASDQKLLFLKQKCSLGDEQIKQIAIGTIGQNLNEKWFMMRKFRLTASNFGTILAACRRNRYPESLFKTLIGTYNLDGVKAIQWGTTHEKNGINFLKNSLNLDVQETGIWLANTGLLGASPDGLVGEDATVEVKCPYAFRNDKLTEKLKNATDKYIIFYDDNGKVIINNSHNYYHQIQGCLHILKRTKCYLCIWTPRETTTVVINYDPSWAQNILILEKFYVEQYIPKLLGQ